MNSYNKSKHDKSGHIAIDQSKSREFKGSSFSNYEFYPYFIRIKTFLCCKVSEANSYYLNLYNYA